MQSTKNTTKIGSAHSSVTTDSWSLIVLLPLCRSWHQPGTCLTFPLLTPPVSPVSTISPLPANLAELDCLKSCSQGPGGALWGTSSQLHLPQSPPEGLQCVGSPAAQWSWRPSMTTTTGGMTDGRSPSERASGLFSWKRPMLTGGRWDHSLSFVSIALKAFYTVDCQSSHPLSSTRSIIRTASSSMEIHLKFWKLLTGAKDWSSQQSKAIVCSCNICDRGAHSTHTLAKAPGHVCLAQL